MLKNVFRLGALALAVACVPLLQQAGVSPGLAQDSPDENQRAQVLTENELVLYRAYLRADHATLLERAKAILADGSSLSYVEFRIALRMLTLAADELGDNQGALKALLAAKAPDVPGAAAALNHELAERQRKLAQPGRASAMDGDIGFLKNWRICGPFGNERGQGFDDVLQPEAGFNPLGEYAGKDNLNVKFRALPASPVAGVVDIGAMLRPNKEAAAFLMTAVHCDSPVTTTLGAASDSALKLWVVSPGTPALPGGVVITEAERSLGFDQDRCNINLARGWNLIIVKAGISEGEWRIRLRMDGKAWREAVDEKEFKDALGAPTDNPTLDYRQEPAAKDKLRAMFFDGACEVIIPRQDRTMGYARGRLTTLLADYEKLAPTKAEPQAYRSERAIISYFLAEASRSGSAVAAGREENRRRALLQSVLELDAKAARAAYSMASYYSNTFVNPSQADSFARKAVELAPDWVEGRIYAARVASLKGLDMEVQRELHGLLKKFPDHPQLLRFAAYYRRLAEDIAGANVLYERAIKADFTDNYTRERMLDRAIENGDVNGAQRIAAEMRLLDPFNIVASGELARMYLAANDPGAALTEVNNALAIAPLDDTYLAMKCEVHMRFAATLAGEAATAQRNLAVEALRAALKANPNRQDLERYLEFLSDERPKFEALLQENIESRIEKALSQPVNGDDPFRTLYRDEITVVNDDGTTAVYSQFAYRICNDQGRPWFQMLGIPKQADQQGRLVDGRLYRMDGTVEEGRRSPDRVEFPPINVGDVVFLRYRVSDREQSFFGDYFGTRVAFASYFYPGDGSIAYSPIDEMRVVFVLPKARQFYEYLTLNAPKRTERVEGDRVVWTYTAKDIARLPQESLQPPLEQLAPTVQISTYKSWKDFGKWYYNLIKKQLEPTPAMTAKVAALIEGKTTEKEKVRAIYNFVVTQIRYNSDWHFGVHGYKPFSAGAIFDRCIGDCKDKAIVMCTMLAITGIKAHPVIINSEYFRGNEDISLPMPGLFNHVIALVEYADGTSQFLDGTATFNGMDELPSSDCGAQVIVVKPEGGVVQTVPQPAADQNREINTIALELQGQGKARITVDYTGIGPANADIRANFLNEGDRKQTFEAIWSQHFPGASTTMVRANDLAAIDSPPRLTYTMNLPNAYDEKDGVIELRVALNPKCWTQKALGSVATRRSDLVLPTPFSTAHTMTFDLPKGTKLEQIPAAYVYKDKFATLRVEVSVKDGTLVVEREYNFHGGVVPRDEYPKFREGLAGFDRAEAAVLKIVKE
ncbi:MAG: DUF3857 domain-containing protein [Planctomycetes bacterium]|nr:DUF3857 domain-containing protein [Planctomycetota bacterium]